MKIKDRRRASNPAAVHRVAGVPDAMLPVYLDNAVMALGQALDSWRFHDAPRVEVDKALDAINALWSEVESRGLGRD